VFLIQQFATGTIAGVLAGAMLCALLRWTVRPAARNVLSALPVGLGYAIGHVAVAGWPAFPPADALNWLFYFSLVSVPVGAVTACAGLKGRGRLVLSTIFCVVALTLLLKPALASSGSLGHRLVWIVAVAGVMVLHWRSLEWLADRASCFGMSVVCLITCSGAGIVLSLSGSLLLAQLALVLAAAIAGTLLGRWWGFVPTSAAIPPLAALIPGLLLGGYAYAELPAASGILLLAAPAGALLPRGAADGRPLALRAALTLIVVAVAVAWAIHASPPLEF
jgi:hypothetical protein